MERFGDVVARLVREERTVVVLQQTEEEPALEVLGEFALLVDSGREQALVHAGWDSSGVYIDVRMFREQEFVPGSVTDILGEVSVRGSR